MKEDLNKFQWAPCPKGQLLLDELIAGFFRNNPFMVDLKKRMKVQTGTRFFDWIDHIQLPVDSELASRLDSAGFSQDDKVWEHHGAIFPRVRNHVEKRIAIKVESIVEFLAAQQIDSNIIGGTQSQLRMAHIDGDLWAVERHGNKAFSPIETDIAKSIQSIEIFEKFKLRRREFFNDDKIAFEAIHKQIDEAISLIGEDWTCDLFFAAERDFWMRRNHAGRVQKARQDRLGLGWANHDHHTYRCRRKTFHQVIEVFEKLGFECRERFYAGAQAGWGAQIVEHKNTGITIFADVDMSAEEVSGDFAHEGFADKPGLGTVGLWCELHGESMLEAGMHHLEAQFDFDSLKDQLLHESGISMMKPFTDFEYLRQQFSEGERWPVSSKRLELLLAKGEITPEEAESFQKNGAIGSHLENLERNDGFKGFNQTGISDIIERTDARKMAT